MEGSGEKEDYGKHFNLLSVSGPGNVRFYAASSYFYILQFQNANLHVCMFVCLHECIYSFNLLLCMLVWVCVCVDVCVPIF